MRIQEPVFISIDPRFNRLWSRCPASALVPIQVQVSRMGHPRSANERELAELLVCVEAISRGTRMIAMETQDERDGTTDQRRGAEKIRRRYPARAAWAAWRARCAGSGQDDPAARQEDAASGRSGTYGLRRLASAT